MVYQFYIKVFKEKEIPHYFAAGLVAILMVSVYQITLDVLFLLTRDVLYETIGEYTKYISLGLVIVSIVYVSSNKRYLKICAEVNSFGRRKSRMMAIFGILYIIVTLGLFIYLGESIRSINLRH